MVLVVFFETSILIAASVREIASSPTPIEHKFYTSSKGLIRSNKIVRITSYTVEEQAENKLEKALKDTIEEIMSKQKLDELTDKDRDRYITILDKVERNFKENVRLLDRLATDIGEVRKVKVKEVLPMYGKIAGDLPPRVWTYARKFKHIAKEVDKIQSRRYFAGLKWKGILPDEIDMEILSEAVCLKRNRFSHDTFFLTSLDKHFSGASYEPWDKIPQRIEELFQISCLFPDEILNKLKSKSLNKLKS